MTARGEGIHELALPDMARRLANVVRVGTIAVVDLGARRVRVKSGDILTAWLPWASGSANAGKRSWSPPEAGEQVTMISPGGDLGQAIVIPGIYQDAYDAPSSDASKDTTTYSDGTVIEYDRATHTLTADLGDSLIKATREEITLSVGSAGIKITSAGVEIIGNLSWSGIGGGAAAGTMNGSLQIVGDTLTHNGKNIGGDHTHGGVQTGGGTTGGPA